MKKIIIVLLALVLFGNVEAQNRNAEIIESLCNEHHTKSALNNQERDIIIINNFSYNKNFFEIGKYYIAGGEHPEYLKYADELDNIHFIESIGLWVYSIYCSTLNFPISKSGMEHIEWAKIQIKFWISELGENYNKRIEEENFKKKNIRINFKDTL